MDFGSLAKAFVEATCTISIKDGRKAGNVGRKCILVSIKGRARMALCASIRMVSLVFGQ